MTDKQLSVLLSQIAARLTNATEAASAKLPLEVERELVKRYVGQSPFPALDPEGWISEPIGMPAALAGIIEIIDDIKRQSEFLASDTDAS